MIRIADKSHGREQLPKLPLENEQIAQRLDEIAELLENQGANPFRVGAYHNAAQTVRNLNRPVHAIIANEGRAGLRKLHGIGESLARTIEQIAYAGQLPLLVQLRGEAGPEEILTTVPGIGPELARRIYEGLGIESLTDLEMAAYDGRLAEVPGMGRRRIRLIRESLAGRFRRRPRVAELNRSPQRDQPPVAELLDVDREYREKAQSGRLHRIAPRRFNPTGEAWLPVLHTRRGEHQYTALFSNTARAHELGTTHDWVVIYRDDSGGQGQWTVVTSRAKDLQGKRVVRGRETECREFYGAGSR